MEEKLLLTTIPLDQFYSEIRKIVTTVVNEHENRNKNLNLWVYIHP